MSVRLFSLLMVISVIGISCGSTPFDRKYHKVTRIVDGNTIEVRPGIYIQLIGVENTNSSMSYLKDKVLGHRIKIKYDRSNSRVKARRGSTLYAYVVTDKRVSVNGSILQKRLSNINTNKLSDSLEIFQLYANGKFVKTPPKTRTKKTKKNTPTEKRSDPTLVELVEDIESAVFLIHSVDDDENPIGLGTGFFIDDRGIGISNHHVFEGGSNHFIQTLDGTIYEVTDIYSVNAEHDYIIFQVDNSKGLFTSLDIKYGDQKKGEPIFVLGNPKGLESTLTTGIISSIRSEILANDFIQFDAAVSPGSSGSPLCNMKGEAIGVVVSKYIDCENCNFAIHMNIIKQDLEYLQY